MIEFKIISVGDIKEKYLNDLIAEYSKRIQKYARISYVVIKDEALVDSEENVRKKEGEKIMEALSPQYYNIALTLNTLELDSIGLAKKIEEITTYHKNKIAFIIGGSYGLHLKVIQNVDLSLSFSKLTFPHQLIKGILLEQIYRSLKILNNETYHK